VSLLLCHRDPSSSAVILTDNGSEFSDPKMIEFYRVDPEHNPTKLERRTPYDEFVSFHGERGREFLEKLGIRRINAESVVLDPILLGEKFKKEANRAILHRHGVL